jgi:hypothetical protein
MAASKRTLDESGIQKRLHQELEPVFYLLPLVLRLCSFVSSSSGYGVDFNSCFECFRRIVDEHLEYAFCDKRVFSCYFPLTVKWYRSHMVRNGGIIRDGNQLGRDRLAWPLPGRFERPRRRSSEPLEFPILSAPIGILLVVL